MSSALRRTHFVYNLGSGNSAGTRFNDFTTICVPRGHTVRVLLFAVRHNRTFPALVVQHFGTLTTVMRCV